MPSQPPMPTESPGTPGVARAGDLPPDVAAFFERLRRLPLGTWADAGRQLEALEGRGVPGSPPTEASRRGAEVRAELRRVVNAMPHEASRIRSRVHDLATVAQGFVHQSDAARMKKAALVAALALVARPALGAERFGRAYEPFAASIPVDSLLAADDAGPAR